MSFISSMKWQIAQFAEIRWWRNYLYKKTPEKYLAWKRNYWINFLEENKDIIQLTDQSAVLDAGCGPAGIFSILPNMKVVAIDPLLSHYKSLPHFDKQNYPWVDFREIQIEHFNTDKKFKTIFCLNVINHVSQLKQAIDNLVRHLEPNGQIVITVDVHRWYLLKLLFSLFPFDILHPHQYTLNQYLKLLIAKKPKQINFRLLKKERVFNYYLISIVK